MKKIIFLKCFSDHSEQFLPPSNTSKTGHDIKKMIFLKCFSDHAEQLLPSKRQIRVTKKEIKSKNY